MSAQAYQTRVYKLLRRVFGVDKVRKEWNIRAGASDVFREVSTYAPRVDIAIGPFNLTVDSAARDAQTIQDASGHPLIETLIRMVEEQNEMRFVPPRNPRCLLAIEIEFSGSSKHILGDITNASMMGLVGVVIGPRENIRKIERVGQYARRLRMVEKAPPGLFTNVAFVGTTHFRRLLNEHLR